MMLSIYKHKSSKVHTLSVKLKLLFLFLISISLFVFESYIFLSFSFLFITVLFLISKLELKLIFKTLLSISKFLLVIFITNIVFKDLENAIKSVLRFSNWILYGSLFSLTTKSIDVIANLESLLKKFTWLGINPTKVSLALSLSLNFIFIIKKVYEEVLIAQESRGVEKNYIGLAIPLIIRTIKFGDEVSESIEARS